MNEFVRVTLTKCGEHFALIDAKSAELIRPYRWSLHHCGKGKLYARAERSPWGGGKLRLYMHLLIASEFLPPKPSAKHVCDHEDGNGLHNWVDNFRWLDGFENRWKYARHREHPAHA